MGEGSWRAAVVATAVAAKATALARGRRRWREGDGAGSGASRGARSAGMCTQNAQQMPATATRGGFLARPALSNWDSAGSYRTYLTPTSLITLVPHGTYPLPTTVFSS